MNRKLRFYSMVMALAAAYAVGPNSGYADGAFVIDAGLNNCDAFFQNQLNCWNDYVCDSVYMDTSLGCASTTNQLFGIIDLEADSVDVASCNTTAGYTNTLLSCDTCPSGKTKVSVNTLLSLDGDDFSYDASNSFIELLHSRCFSGGCQIDDDLYACVTCLTKRTYGSWTTYNSTNKSVRRTVNTRANCATSATTSYEYGCAANSYYYSGSGTSIVCKECPSNATCPTTAGHTSGFTCNKNYYKDSTSCTKCASATQSYTTAAKTTLKAGTSAVGSTAATSCYIDKNTTLYDEKGTFTTPAASNCYYSTTATTNLL